MHSYTVFLIAFIDAFGWTRGEASIAYAISQMVTGGTSPLVGALVDRLGPRRMVIMGGFLLSAGLIASAWANALWHVIVLYGIVMTLGANCLGLVVFVPILSRRFVRRRGPENRLVLGTSGVGPVARLSRAIGQQQHVLVGAWKLGGVGIHDPHPNQAVAEFDIRRAVEELFNVKVVRVHTQNRKGKPRRTRFKATHTRDWKKAIVKLDAEHRNELC